MAFIDWLRKQHEESERNRRLFENRPDTLRAGEVPTHEMVAANRAWGGGPGSGSGYQDRPGGQRLMVRQPKMPKVDNTLTIKDDGTRTHVKKWTDPDASTLRTGSVPHRETHPVNLQPWPVRKAYWGDRSGLRDMAMSQEEGLFRNEGALSPEAQAAISQVQATRGQNVDASGRPITGTSLANLGIPIRAMGNTISRMDRSMQGIRDRLERDRIRRLMQHKRHNRNPYYPTGNPYGLNLTNRNPYPRGIY